MRVIRFHSEEGQRTGLLVKETPKYLYLILVKHPLRMLRVPATERRHMLTLDYPVEKSKRILRRAAKDWHGGLRNVPRSVREALARDARGTLASGARRNSEQGGG